MFLGHDAVGFASKRATSRYAAGFAGYLIPLWAMWIDRHREARG